MEIKATCKCDFETFKKFNRFHAFTRIKAVSIALIVLDVILVFAFLLLLLCELITFELIIMYLFVFLANGMVLFANHIFPIMQYKKNKILSSITNKFVFGEESFNLAQQSSATEGSVDIKYDALYKVYETAGFFYLYTEPNRAHIVDKTAVTGGTVEDLRLLLKGAVGEKKYKIKM